MSTPSPTDEAALPPVPCSACAAAIEASELRWVKCGGLSVGTHRQPMVWRLRDKYSSDVIQQNTKYAQRLAAAARLVHALKEHVTDPEASEAPSGEQVASDALFALRIRSLIADKEMITARANDALARGGQWDCDYHAWYQEVDSEIQYLLKANTKVSDGR